MLYNIPCVRPNIRGVLIYTTIHHITTLYDRRTLRVLFALARGSPIVTEEWVYACLCENEVYMLLYTYLYSICVHYRADILINLFNFYILCAVLYMYTHIQWLTDYTEYYHPRYSHLYDSLVDTSTKPKPLFTNDTFYIMKSSFPQPSVLTALLTACGGIVVNTCALSTYTIFGEAKDAACWLSDLDEYMSQSASEDFEHVLKLSQDKKIITSKVCYSV